MYKAGHACAFEHGFDPIAESVLASDTIVFAVPVYYFAMPGQAKNILDHFYVLDYSLLCSLGFLNNETG